MEERDMVCIIRGMRQGNLQGPLESMFEDRRRLFVDLLRWDVPVVDGRFEKALAEGLARIGAIPRQATSRRRRELPRNRNGFHSATPFSAGSFVRQRINVPGKRVLRLVRSKRPPLA